MRGGFETRLVLLHEIRQMITHFLRIYKMTTNIEPGGKKLSRKKKTVIFLKTWINVRVCWCVKLNLTSVFYIHLVEALNPIWQSTDLLLCILNHQLPNYPCGVCRYVYLSFHRNFALFTYLPSKVWINFKICWL